MTRADCQALSKHYHVCWLSIPCSQHKIGGQRIIGVRDGKDIWGQLVHPSTLSHPLFQIILYVIFSPSTPMQFSRSSLCPSHHLWGTMVEVLVSFSMVKRDIAIAPNWHSWTLLVVSAEMLKASRNGSLLLFLIESGGHQCVVMQAKRGSAEFSPRFLLFKSLDLKGTGIWTGDR